MDGVWTIYWGGKYEYHDDGSRNIEDISEIFEVLKENRDPDGDGEFLISREGTKKECLMLNVSGDRWNLYYVTEDDDCAGFNSLGDDTENEEIYNLPAGSNIDVPGYYIVSEEIAFQAAKEFVETTRMPTCLEWFEL